MKTPPEPKPAAGRQAETAPGSPVDEGAPSAAAPLPRRVHLAAFCMDGSFFLMAAAVPYKVLQLGGGPAILGLVPAVAGLTYVVLAQVAGRWSDRHPRPRLCRTGSAVLIGFALVLPLCRSLLLLLLLVTVMSLGKALFWPPLQSLLGDLSRSGRLARNTSLFNIAWSGGKALGFLSAGWLLARGGFAAAFLVGAVLALGALLAVPSRDERRRVRSTGPTGGERLAPVPRAFLHVAWLANLVAYGAAGVLNYHLPQWFTQLGWNQERFGLLLGVIMAAQTTVFVLLAVRPRSGRSLSWFLLPLAGAMVAMALLPLLRSYGLLLALAPLLGIAFGSSYAASIYYSLEAPAQRGRNAGIHESLIGLGGLVPPFLGGLAADWSGRLEAPYLLSAVLILAALLTQLAMWQRLARSARLQA
jgi:MFS family permease